MKKWFFTCLIWLVIKLNVYRVWSKIHQALFQRRRTTLPDLKNVNEVMQIVCTSQWSADKWWMLWDVISHPEFAYHRYLSIGTLGDCDDYAAFTAHYVRKWHKDVRILSMQWLDTKGKFRGHNVCIYDNNGEFCMISNGFRAPKLIYNIPGGINYFVRGGELIAWFTMDPKSLKVTDYRIGEDDETKLG